MLEAAQYPQNNFLTLTYSDEHLPLTDTGLPTLDPRRLQLFLKRLRKAHEPNTFRFFGVGEYSDAWRPHYHLILFNYPSCSRGQTRTDWKGTPSPRDCCSVCRTISDLWSIWRPNPENSAEGGFVTLGLIYCATVTDQSAQYVAGYVEKKLTSDKSEYNKKLLQGRHPEFSRMSTKGIGGIGAGMMHEVASDLMRYDLEKTMSDVPDSLRHGKRVMPLGRYLRGKLREAMGRDKKAPQATLDKMAEEMRELRTVAFDNSTSFREEIVKASEQQRKNSAARRAIAYQRKKGKTLK